MGENKDIQVVDSIAIQRNEREDSIIKNALMFVKSSELKWADARGQKGPSPSDFGEHEPIPVDAVCASVVITDTKED
jgi:hypothetical protein